MGCSKGQYLKMLSKKVKKGGVVLLEAFSKNHIDYKKKNPKVGGPSDWVTLYSKEELTSYFENYEIIVLEEKEIELSEGLYHNGKGAVIRFIGQKK